MSFYVYDRGSFLPANYEKLLRSMKKVCYNILCKARYTPIFYTIRHYTTLLYTTLFYTTHYIVLYSLAVYRIVLHNFFAGVGGAFFRLRA